MSDEASISSEYGVVISKPAGAPTGLTVLLPGTLLDLESYDSTREVLLSKNQLVIGFKKLNPFKEKHAVMAANVVAVVEKVCALNDYALLRDKKYSIVGHSLGGKLALMVAAKYDQDKVDVIIALDPVDDKPQELTTKPPLTNLSDTKASQIHLLQSELGGKGFLGLFPLAPKDKNATVIKDTYKEIFVPNSPNYTLFINLGAKHMSYLDNELDQASQDARESAHKLIRDHIGA